MNAYRVTFHLDGTGIYYDPREPLHLDALLVWYYARIQGVWSSSRSVEPPPVKLPVKQSTINGHKVHHASALLPDGHTLESLWHWRKRFRQNRCEMTVGSPNLTNGPYRDWQVPMPMLLCTKMVGYVVGHRKDLRKALQRVQALGKKRAHGHGKVLGFEIEPADEDYSLVRNGRAMRWLPTPNGTRLVRPIPPYWHPLGRVPCCEVGDEFEIN